MSVSPADLQGPYDVVFDVGAYVGDFAKACLRAWPQCRVYSFDPLREVVNLPDGGRWRWHRVALGDTERRQAVLWRNEFEPSSSLLPMADAHKEAFPYTVRAESTRVEIRRLVEYAQYVEGQALLKIDVQGAELEVLKGAGSALDGFDAVVLEVSHIELYHGAPTPLELARFLSDHGFRHDRRVDEMPHPVTRRLLQSDELWVRT